MLGSAAARSAAVGGRGRAAAVRGRPPLALVVAGLVVGVLAAIPLVYLVIRAAGARSDLLDLVIRPRTFEVLGSTVLLGAAVGVGACLVGVPVAWLTSRSDLPGRRLWAVLTIVPLAIPSYVTAFALIAALGPNGALRDALAPLGVDRIPSIYGFPGAALVLILATYPYVVLSTRAALLRFDPALDEAARSLGDDGRQAFRRVSLPLLVPAIAAGALLAVLYALADFGAVALLQFDSFARAIFVQYRASFDRNLAAVLALMLVVLTAAAAAAELAIRRRVPHVVRGSTHRVPRPSPLGPWRWPAVAFCATVVGFALVLPAGTILFWLLRGLAAGEPLRIVGGAAVNSLIAGLGAAVAAVVLALPVALLVSRWPGRLASLVQGTTYGAYSLPGIVVALSVVFLTANAVPALYQTLALLLLAYAVRFLPQAIGTTRVALGLVAPRLGEAARSLGRSPLSAFLTVTLPLLRPGLVAGAALVFLTTVKELPMTLILAPTGFGTLATAIWSASTEGFYARAAGPAALLMLVSVATVAILLRSEERR
jgi:iron(III) transport system permease protein